MARTLRCTSEVPAPMVMARSPGGLTTDNRVWWARLGSNQRPIGYEPTALPLSYGPEGAPPPPRGETPLRLTHCSSATFPQQPASPVAPTHPSLPRHGRSPFQNVEVRAGLIGQPDYGHRLSEISRLSELSRLLFHPIPLRLRYRSVSFISSSLSHEMQFVLNQLATFFIEGLLGPATRRVKPTNSSWLAIRGYPLKVKKIAVTTTASLLLPSSRGWLFTNE